MLIFGLDDKLPVETEQSLALVAVKHESPCRYRQPSSQYVKLFSSVASFLRTDENTLINLLNPSEPPLLNHGSGGASELLRLNRDARNYAILLPGNNRLT